MAIIQNLKNSVYLAIKIQNILVVNSTAFGGFAPRPPPGLRPWTLLGDFRPQTTSDLLPPGQIPSYATVQIIYVSLEKSKLLPPYPLHLKNVTTLPSEM